MMQDYLRIYSPNAGILSLIARVRRASTVFAVPCWIVRGCGVGHKGSVCNRRPQSELRRRSRLGLLLLAVSCLRRGMDACSGW